MLMIVGFVLAFIAFFVATMMTFQVLVYKWNSRYAIPMA